MSESEGLSTLANWMIAHGYATGHGDTAEDLLSELVAQVSGGDGMVRVPREPSIGLLVSIACRLDHSFYAQRTGMSPFILDESDDEFRRRQQSLLADAKRAHEEIVGKGFYAPEREDYYVAMPAAAEKETG